MDLNTVPMTEDIISLLAAIQTGDISAKTILADALEIAGYDDSQTLNKMRQANEWSGMHEVRQITQRVLTALHSRMVESRVAMLEAEAKEAYSNREVSKGYWRREIASALRNNPGYLRVEIGSLMHPSHREPGTIYIRRATAGKFGRSKAVRFGRQLTINEMRSMA